MDRFLATFFDPNLVARYLPDLLLGVGVTIAIGLAVVATGLLIGLLLAILRSFEIRILNALIIGLVDMFRALPPLVIILLIYFGLPNIGIVLPNFLVLWLSLSAVLAAFSEELFWAGIIATPRGQWLAAQSTGLSFVQTLFHVVLPQAIRMSIAPLTNRAISITKNTSLGSAIGVSDVLGRAMTAQAFSANATPLMMAAIIYVIIFVPLVAVSRFLERRTQWGVRR